MLQLQFSCSHTNTGTSTNDRTPPCLWQFWRCLCTKTISENTDVCVCIFGLLLTSIEQPLSAGKYEKLHWMLYWTVCSWPTTPIHLHTAIIRRITSQNNLALLSARHTHWTHYLDFLRLASSCSINTAISWTMCWLFVCSISGISKQIHKHTYLHE